MLESRIGAKNLFHPSIDGSREYDLPASKTMTAPKRPRRPRVRSLYHSIRELLDRDWTYSRTGMIGSEVVGATDLQPCTGD